LQLTSGVEDWKHVSRHRVATLNPFDAACRIVDHTHTHDTWTGSCQSHPLITWEDCLQCSS